MQKTSKLGNTIFLRPLHDKVIYALLCPDTKKIKYIGQTIKGFNRIRDHYYDHLGRKSATSYRKINWVRKLVRENKIFEVQYLEYCENKEQLDICEKKWIVFYRNLGHDLLNHTDGGDNYFIPKYTEEEKKLISIRTKLAMLRPEVRERARLTHLGKANPNKGKSFGPEFSKKITEANYRNAKKVIDSEGNIYRGIKEVADKLNISWSTAKRIVINNKKVNGISFKYEER